MKNLVSLLCVISALLVSVYPYKCMSGMSRNSTTCNETEIECLGDRCMTISQYTYIDGVMYESIMKGCANETLCLVKGSVAAEKVKFQFHVNCCPGNKCNTDGYDVLPEDPTPNGVKCPSALCLDTLEECSSDKVINCTGSMDHCFDFREHEIDTGERDERFSVKGCINSDACKFNFDNVIGVTVLEKKYVNCYIPPKSNHLQ